MNGRALEMLMCQEYELPAHRAAGSTNLADTGQQGLVASQRWLFAHLVTRGCLSVRLESKPKIKIMLLQLLIS